MTLFYLIQVYLSFIVIRLLLKIWPFLNQYCHFFIYFECLNSGGSDYTEKKTYLQGVLGFQGYKAVIAKIKVALFMTRKHESKNYFGGCQ